MKKYNPPYAICNDCADHFYPSSVLDMTMMSGITIHQGDCKACGRKKTWLTPVRDFLVALHVPGMMWD